MGEAADDILEGRTCQCCGVYFDKYLEDYDFDGYGYPVTCPDCDDENDTE